MEDCLFCKIITGEIPSAKLYEDDLVIAIKDIAPVAPFHALLIPKEHIASSPAEIAPGNSAVVARIFEVAASLARENGLAGGFRVVANSGEAAGQTVPHLHFHLLGGRMLGPMG